MKPEILQIAPMLPRVEAALGDAYTVHRYWEAADQPALLAALARGARVATDGHHGFRPTSWRRCRARGRRQLRRRLRRIDIAACKARGIRVTNTPDVLTTRWPSCARPDARALPAHPAGRRLCPRRPLAHGNFGLTGELTGAHAGILGLGRIGKEIARRPQAMRMRVSYHGRREQAHEPYAYYPELVAMARDVDWLVVIAPGSAATAGIVSREVLEALGPKGALVNVARGSLIDEPAMVELLAAGRLGGAALDVFADEPRVPEALFALPNVVLSPHQGSATTRPGRRWATWWSATLPRTSPAIRC